MQHLARQHTASFERCALPVCGLTDEYPAGFIDPLHAHDRIQVLYACSGVMSIVTSTTSFVVPPRRAVWLPAGMLHEVSCRGPVSLRTLYVDPARYAQAPACRVIDISDFLRALILKVVSFGHDYDMQGQAGRIVEVLLDEIDAMPLAPYGDDAGRSAIAPGMPRDSGTTVGQSRRRRTDAHRRDGAPHLHPRVQARDGHGTCRVAPASTADGGIIADGDGRPVTTVAFDVRYDSPSAFAAMFRRAYGVPPSMYALP